MIYGYARCSLALEGKQNIDRQINELKKAGCDIVAYEQEHGDAAVKKELNALLETVKEGDTVMVLEVSRLARSTKQLLDIIDVVKEKKLCLKILNSITVDCRSGSLDPMTQAFVAISAVFSELELNIIRERVKSGMKAAANRGARIGRPKLTTDNIPQVFYKHYPSYVNGKMNLSELARVCNLSRNTIYHYLSILNNKKTSIGNG